MIKNQSNYDGYLFAVRSTLACNPNILSFAVDYDFGAGERLGVTALQLLNDGEWHHACGVVDRDAETVHLYVDGVEDIGAIGCGAASTNSTGYGSSNSGTTPFLIGKRFNHASSLWNGEIDEVRIYNRALSVEEVQVLLNL
jgi:hypothetical protein